MKAKKLGFRKYGWMFGRAAVLLITAALWASPVAAQELGASAVSRTNDNPGRSHFFDRAFDRFRDAIHQQ